MSDEYMNEYTELFYKLHELLYQYENKFGRQYDLIYYLNKEQLQNVIDDFECMHTTCEGDTE